MSLPPKTVTTPRSVSRSISCLRLREVQSASSWSPPPRADDERADAGALGDDVVGGERPGQVEAGVDLVEQELAVLVGDVGERGVDAGVGGADHRAVAHRDDVEQPPGVVEEGEHAVVAGRREAGDDQVDALGVDDAVPGLQAPGGVELVDERADRVDHDPGRGRDARRRSRCRAAGTPTGRRPARPRPARRSWRRPRRPRSPSARRRRRSASRCRRGRRRGTARRRERCVVSMTGSTSSSCSASNTCGRLRAEQADAPVGGRPERREPRPVRRGAVERRQEGDLLDVVGVGLHQPVAGTGQAEDEGQLVVLEVLEAAPHQVGRLLAGEAAEVAAVDERDGRAATRERCGRDGAVDAGADDEHVEQATVDPRDVGSPQGHAPSVADRGRGGRLGVTRHRAVRRQVRGACARAAANRVRWRCSARFVARAAAAR